MKGYLTLYSNNRRQLTSTLETIQNYIEKRTSSYLSENILAISYIGERQSVGVGMINPSILSRPMFGGRRKLSRSIGKVERSSVGHYSAVFILSCMAALLAFKKTKQRREPPVLSQRHELQVV